MTRVYHTQEDIDNEEKAIPLLEWSFGCTIEHSKDKFSTYDYKMRDRSGRHIGWIEYRKRHHRSTKYKTIMLSKTKFKPENTLPTFFVVEWSDMIGVRMLDMKWGEHSKPFLRTINPQRGPDVEQVIWMYVHKFEVIKRKC